MSAMSAAEIRKQAMAMLAEADEAEGVTTVIQPVGEAVEPDPGGMTEEEYTAYVLAQAEVLEDPVEAWQLVADSWDVLDGNQTLAIVGQFAFRFAQPVDAAVDDATGPVLDNVALARRAALAALEQAPRTPDYFSPLELQALTLGVTMGAIFESREAEAAAAQIERQEAEALPPPPVGHPALASRLRPAEAAPVEEGAQARTETQPLPRDESVPRGMRRRPDPHQRAEAQEAPRGPLPVGNGTKVVLNQPLKQGAPRKASGHNIPAHLQSYVRDPRTGRMVLRDQLPGAE